MDTREEEIATLDFLIHILGHSRRHLAEGSPNAAHALQIAIEKEYDSRNATREDAVGPSMHQTESAATMMAEAANAVPVRRGMGILPRFWYPIGASADGTRQDPFASRHFAAVQRLVSFRGKAGGRAAITGWRECRIAGRSWSRRARLWMACLWPACP